MTKPERSPVAFTVRSASVALVALAVLAALIVSVATGSPARAMSLKGAPGSCPTDYSGSTVADCNTTSSNTAAQMNLVLTASYGAGVVTWQVCGFPASSAGTSVQFYLNGNAITAAGGTSVVTSGGCTGSARFNDCLAPGSYPVAGVSSVGQATGTLNVASSGCSNPVTVSTSGQKKSGLAFTGSNVLLLVLIAAALILLGALVVKLSRRRRHAS